MDFEKEFREMRWFLLVSLGFAAETIIIGVALIAVAVSAVEVGRVVAPNADWPPPMGPVEEEEKVETPAAQPLPTPESDVPPSRVTAAYFSGVVLEELVGKLVLQHGLAAGVCRQVGAQLQIAALEERGLISPNPVLAFGQGFLVGL